MAKTKPLTTAEKAWIQKLQSVLDECPSHRMEAYTVGDADITIFDKNPGIEDYLRDHRSSEVCTAVSAVGAELAHIKFPFCVQSTAG